MTQPDVSVIIAVYNTMPYLRDCLDSLVTQSIGMDRLQIILIDDGSDDGSERLVDEFAGAHPELVTVIHQANSGTPAAPFNRGMELATGRYLFFLGADDYLGAEALERLVRAADDWDSDVVFGKNVGVGGHPVNTRVFSQGTVRDLDLFDSFLPYGLSNSKLFRREMIESLGLTYREDIRSRCDQPFTLTAIVHSRRVSVLTDYDYYYGVKRADESNVTFTTDPAQTLRSAKVIMDTIADLIEPGPRRDFVMKRQFHLEMSRLVGEAFLDFDPESQRAVIEGVGALADSYLTETIRRSLNVRPRMQLVLAQRRDLEGLIEADRAVKAYREGGRLTFVADGERRFTRYPGFRERGNDDETFELLDEPAIGRLARAFRSTAIRYEPAGIVIDAELDVIGLDRSMLQAEIVPIDRLSATKAARFSKRAMGDSLPLSFTAGPDMTRLTVTVPKEALTGRDKDLWSLRLRMGFGGKTYDLPFSTPAGAAPTSTKYRGATGSIKPEAGPEGRLVIRRVPRRNIRSIARALKRG